MYYRIDEKGFYLGVQSSENQNWEFQTDVEMPTNFRFPKFENGLWIDTYIQEVPPTISQMNLRLQLIAENISIASVYDTIEQIPDAITKETIYTKWEYALIFERADQTLNQMAQMLNVSQEQLDRIFINGNQN